MLCACFDPDSRSHTFLTLLVDIYLQFPLSKLMLLLNDER